MRTITLVGCRFRHDSPTGLIFTIDHASRSTVTFHADGENRAARQVPAASLIARLDRGEYVMLQSDSLEAASPHVYRAVRRALVALQPVDAEPACTAPPATLETDVLALLADGPKAMRDLAPSLRVSPPVIRHALNRLLVRGQVKRLGHHQAIRWALPTWTPADGEVPPPKPGHRTTGPSRPSAAHATSSWWIAHAAPEADRRAFAADLAARAKDPLVAHDLAKPRSLS